MGTSTRRRTSGPPNSVIWMAWLTAVSCMSLEAAFFSTPRLSLPTGRARRRPLLGGPLRRAAQHLVERRQPLGHLHDAGHPQRPHAFEHALAAEPGHVQGRMD